MKNLLKRKVTGEQYKIKYHACISDVVYMFHVTINNKTKIVNVIYEYGKITSYLDENKEFVNNNYGKFLEQILIANGANKK